MVFFLDFKHLQLIVAEKMRQKFVTNGRTYGRTARPTDKDIPSPSERGKKTLKFPIHNNSAISRIILIKIWMKSNNNKFHDYCLKNVFFLFSRQKYFICLRMTNEILQDREFINSRFNSFLFKNRIETLIWNMF